MIKDRSVIEILEVLQGKIDFTSIEFVDYWDGDLSAVGFKMNHRLVYISTYKYPEVKKGTYYFEFELLDENSDENYKIVKRAEDVGQDELIREIKAFLGV